MKSAIPPSLALGAFETIAKVASLGPGERVIYFTGDLAWSRSWSCGAIGDNAAMLKLRALADGVYRLWEMKRLHLVQRRIDTGTFEYIAIGRSGGQQT